MLKNVVLLISSPSCKQIRNAKTEEVKNNTYEREREIRAQNRGILQLFFGGLMLLM